MEAVVEPIAKAKRWRRWIIFAAVLLCLYFFLPLMLHFSASLLIRRDPLQPADIVVALGGGVPCMRQDYAVELYQQGLAKKIVINGLAAEWGTDTEKTVRQHFINLGVPESDLVFAGDTGNTRAEAELLAHMMRKNGWKSAIIVTDPYHTRRATYTCERAASDLQFLAAPVSEKISSWKQDRWWTRRGDVWLTIREFVAWGNTLVGGLR